VEEIINFERVVKRSAEKADYETAIKYLDNIICECPYSLEHHLQKIEYLVKAFKLKEALEFSQQVVQKKQFANNP
jgi:hypothetical protein